MKCEEGNQMQMLKLLSLNCIAIVTKIVLRLPPFFLLFACNENAPFILLKFQV